MVGDSPSRELYGVREQAAAAGACQFRNKTLWFSRLAPTALWHADRRASPGGAGREAQSIRLPPDALARSPGTAPLPASHTSEGAGGPCARFGPRLPGTLRCAGRRQRGQGRAAAPAWSMCATGCPTSPAWLPRVASRAYLPERGRPRDMAGGRPCPSGGRPCKGAPMTSGACKRRYHRALSHGGRLLVVSLGGRLDIQSGHRGLDAYGAHRGQPLAAYARRTGACARSLAAPCTPAGHAPKSTLRPARARAADVVGAITPPPLSRRALAAAK